MRTIYAISLAVVAAFALTAPAFASPETPAVATPGTTNPNAPVAGANSYTEGQAQEQIEAKGYTRVSGLRQDDNGVWRGKAMKNGRTMNVSVDFQGNVVAN